MQANLAFTKTKMSKAVKKAKVGDNGPKSKVNKSINTMLELRKSEIPERLHSSEFYKSLSENEDDEMILVPADCYRETDSVKSVADFGNELKLLRFWGLPITFEVFKYGHDNFSKEPDRFNSVANSLRRDWKELQAMIRIISWGDNKAEKVEEAVKSGCIPLLEFLRASDNYNCCRLTCEHAIIAIKHKDAPMFEYIFNNRLVHDEYGAYDEESEKFLAERVVANGDIDCFKVLLRYYIGNLTYLTGVAIEEGRVEHLEALESTGRLSMDWKGIWKAFEGESLAVVKFCVNHYTHDSEALQSEANAPDYDDDASGIDEEEGEDRFSEFFVTIRALVRGNLDMMKVAHEAGHKWVPDAVKRAVDNPDIKGEESLLEVVRYLHEVAGCAANSLDVLAKAIFRSNLPLLAYLLDRVADHADLQGAVHAVATQREVYNACRRVPNVDMLKELFRRGVNLPETFVRLAAVHGQKEESFYLYREVHPTFQFTSSMYEDVLNTNTFKHAAALEILVDHNCPWPRNFLCNTLMRGRSISLPYLRFALEPSAAPGAQFPELRACGSAFLKVSQHILLTEKGCPWSEAAADECITEFRSHEELVGLREKAHMPWTNNSMDLIIRALSLTSVNYALKQGCPTNPNNYTTVAIKRHCDNKNSYFEALYKHGCVWDGSACLEEAHCGYDAALKFASKKKLSWDVKAVAAAKKRFEEDQYDLGVSSEEEEEEEDMV